MDDDQRISGRPREQKDEDRIKSLNEVVSLESLNGSVDEPEERWPHSKIRFSPQVIVVEVKARSLITTVEKRAIWYQSIDFSRISSMNRISVKALRENPDNQDHCPRGLEHKLHGDSDRIKELRVNSIFAVLKEQLHQRKLSTLDEMRIAKVYKDHVFASARKAVEFGLIDEKFAMEEENHKIERRRSSAVVFDDFDLKELQDLDLHDDMDRFEARMSEVQSPTETYEVRSDKKRHTDQKPRCSVRRSLSPKLPTKSSRSNSPEARKCSDSEEKSPRSRRSLSGKLSKVIRKSLSPKPGRSLSTGWVPERRMVPQNQ